MIILIKKLYNRIDELRAVRLCNRRGAAAARVACTLNARRSRPLPPTPALCLAQVPTLLYLSISLVGCFQLFAFLLTSFTLKLVDLLTWILFVHFSIISHIFFPAISQFWHSCRWQYRVSVLNEYGFFLWFFCLCCK